MTRLLRLLLVCAAYGWGAPVLAQPPEPTTEAAPAPATVAQPAAPSTAPAPGAAVPARTPRVVRPARDLPPLEPAEEPVVAIEAEAESCDGIRRNPGFRLGQDHVVRKGEAIDDFATVFGSVVVEGDVCGDLSVTLGDVRIASSGSVEGTLVVVGGTATIEPGAVVGGELVLVGGTLDAPADFRPGREQVVIGLPIIGQHLRQAVPYVTRGLLLGRLIVPDLGWIWAVVAVVFFVQLLLNLLFPQATAATAAVIAERPLSTFMAGLLVIVLSAPVATLLAVTVIGIAALPVLFGALIVGWVIGKIAVNRWIGTRLFEQDDPGSRLESTRSLVIGFVVLTIAYMIPLLGVVVWGLTGVLGLGAAALAFVRGYRRENPPAVRAARDVPAVPPAVPPVPPASSSAFDAMALGVTTAGGSIGDQSGPRPRASVNDAFTLPPAFAGDVPPFTTAAAAAPSEDPRTLLAYPRASFGERAAAFALDVLLVALLAAFLGVDEPGDHVLPWLVVYHVAFWFWKATTLGGIICQLRVVRLDGAPLRFVDTLVRGLVGVFSMAAFGLGGLWILRDAERQAWHDKVAGTIVVRVPRGHPLP